MWDPSATPQDPDMLVHALEGPVAQNFRPADVILRTDKNYLSAFWLDASSLNDKRPCWAAVKELSVSHYMRGTALRYKYLYIYIYTHPLW